MAMEDKLKINLKRHGPFQQQRERETTTTKENRPSNSSL
jgi:hypothetical protein